MFRRKILEKRTKPDALDSLLVVVTPRSILAFGSLAVVLGVGLVWSILAKIPVTVEGQGILMRPGLVAPLEAVNEGRVNSVLVEVGQEIQAGTVIALLSQPSLERELDRLNEQFDVRKRFSDRQITLATRSRKLESDLNLERKQKIVQTLSALMTLQEASTKGRNIALVDRRDKLNRIRDLIQRQQGEQGKRATNITELRNRGIVRNDIRLAAIEALTSSEIESARIELQLSDVELSELDAIREELQSSREIQDLEASLIQIEISDQEAERGFSNLIREEEETIEEIAARIRSLRQELTSSRRISSPYSGVVLELLANEGALTSPGRPLAMMRLAAQKSFLRIALAPDTKMGTLQIVVNGIPTKILSPEMDGAALVTALQKLPSFKGIVARSVSGRLLDGPVDIQLSALDGGSLPELIVEGRDRDLWTLDGRPGTSFVSILGANIPDKPLIHIGFFPIGRGKQIAPGYEIRVDPTSIKRQRYGSLLAEVLTVSEFAITTESLLQIVGNSSVAESFGSVGGVIMVEAKLFSDPSNPTGFIWTSKSPDFPITEGTTTTARVVVEERRPISFVIPLLRKWLLGEGATQAAQVAAGGGA